MEDLSLVELKAMVYDKMVLVESVSKEIAELNQLIMKKVSEQKPE